MKAIDILNDIERQEKKFVMNGDESLSDATREQIDKNIDWQEIEKFNAQNMEREKWNNLHIQRDSQYMESMRANASITSMIPPSSKMYQVKRVINRIMRLTNQFQQNFNHGAVHEMEQINSNMENLYTYVSDLGDEFQETNLNLRREIEAKWQERTQLQNLISELEGMKNQLSEFENVKNEINKKISEERDALNGLREWMSVLDTRMQGDEKWIGNVAQNTEDMSNAYKQLRDELFYELDHRIREINGETKASKIMVKDSYYSKLEKFGGIKKVNLGCGPQDFEGYINVDARDLPNVDIIASALDIPFGENELDEILTSHLIEHFTSQVMEKEILPYWYSKLKEGGVLRCILPNIDFMIRKYAKGDITFGNLEEITMGGQEYEGNCHYAMYSVDKLKNMLLQCGFKNVEVVAEARENGACWEMELAAFK